MTEDSQEDHSAPAGEYTFWEAVRAAIRGAPADLTEAPLKTAIVLMAVPMVLEMVMESVFAIVDIFWVSKLGSESVAAVGLTEAMLALVYTVAMGLSIGVMAVVSRRTGEKDPDAAARATVQAIWLGVSISVGIAVIGWFHSETLLRAMRAPPEVIEVGIGYTRAILVGNAAILLLFLINAAFRGAGDAAIAMRVLWLGNGINLVLDPVLIFGLGPFPELGVTGAGIATVTGRSIAVLVQLITLASLSDRLRVRFKHLSVQPVVMWRLIRLSATGTFQFLISMASWLILVRILAGFGAQAVAGYTIGIRIVLFALLPSWGMANAAATLVGQGLGAGKPERAEAAVWLAGRLNLYFLGSVGIVLIAFAPQIVELFGGDPVAKAHAVNALRIIAAGFFFYAYGMVLTQSFNGAGDAWTPTFINLLCFWLWEIPLAYFLATRTALGPSGVYWAIMLAFSSVAVISAVLFKRGSWKDKAV
ncbi:MAG: MATE family efflux transporter [Longimicrobiales bacterium]